MASVPFNSSYAGSMNPAVAAVIAASGTKTGAIPLKGFCLAGISLPAAFTGTALTFEASVDNVTFQVLKVTTSGTSLSYTVAQGTFCAIDPKDFQGVNFLKIVSGSTEGSARTLLCALKGI